MSEVFSTEHSTSGQVELFVNSTSKGMKSTNNLTLASFVKAQAQQYGIRTFSVYLDGRKADTSEGALSISASKVEIVAKDARGHIAATA